MKLQNKDGWTGLHIIERYAHDQLAVLFELAKTHSGIKNALVETIKRQSKCQRRCRDIEFFGIVKASEIFKHSDLGLIMEALEGILEGIKGMYMENFANIIILMILNPLTIDLYISSDDPLEISTVIEKIRNYIDHVHTVIFDCRILANMLNELSNQLEGWKENSRELDIRKITALAAAPDSHSSNTCSFLSRRRSPAPEDTEVTPLPTI